MKIALTSVFVSDPIAAFKFYTEVLGFVEKTYMPEYLLAIVVSAEDPNGTALLLEPNHNPIAATYQREIYAAGLPIIVFGVRDLQAEYERLSTKGIIFRQEPTRTDYGFEAVFDDTFGNFIQIVQVDDGK